MITLWVGGFVETLLLAFCFSISGRPRQALVCQQNRSLDSPNFKFEVKTCRLALQPCQEQSHS
jgi:hypothetical protein